MPDASGPESTPPSASDESKPAPKKHKKQPVQFVDPMQSAYFGDDEDFEPDEL